MAGARDAIEEDELAAGLPLTPAVFHIMLALADGERHGYSILREVERYTEGRLKLGPTTLYRSIRQMQAAGYIVETESRPDPELDDERRRYYRLTDAGRRVALAETRRLARLVSLAQSTSLGASLGAGLSGQFNLGGA
ncbi:MAG TPA: PadR family transcriptional regulator [Ktedonobacterales bacterium]|jgi:DNA-binding PadR family transcriptional regulator|nr:PadR family transcriptional regulator [Ktedonobacterales bacterium]